ncbi:MAG: pyridoxal phosphate-dependent aminotransferase [Bacteroidales bacterium]|nr:pyridoxal phosphate-dependent aminotransferase [Bacteroidales bacterium]
MNINKHLFFIPPAATLAIADRVRVLKREGKEIIALQTGDPDFDTPHIIIEAGSCAMKEGMTHYADSRGLLELREAIAQKIKLENGGVYDPTTEILVTNGGAHAYYCALMAITNPGDEILIPDPDWMTHVNIVSMMRGIPKRIESSIENGFWPTIQEIERNISPRTIAIVLNSPNNPTGSVASFEYLQQVVECAKRNDLYIISDEVYEYILYDGIEHASIAQFKIQYNKLIIINSFSKSYAMTGWRIGYLAAPGEIISIALKASQNTITNVPGFVQKAALCALTEPSIKSIIKKMMAQYAVRRDHAMEILRQGEPYIHAFTPKGAFYLFIDVGNLRMPSVEVAERLLNESLIAMAPGSAYGNCGEGYLRMTLAASDVSIKKGVSGLLNWAKQF